MRAYPVQEHNKTTQVAGTPPFDNVGFRNILVGTLNNVGHPTRRPHYLNSIRVMVSYIVQCLHNVYFKLTLRKRGVPPTSEARPGKYKKQ